MYDPRRPVEQIRAAGATIKANVIGSALLAWALVLSLGWGTARAEPAAKPAAKPPNILIILADDLGFSDLGCYGGEIATPNLDRLAAGGLRFTQFYNTSRCWPTRSAILTGYYPQQIRMDPPQGKLPPWTRMLPHYLKPAGYRAYHSGKWHVRGAPRAVAQGGFDRALVIEDHDRYFNPRHQTQDDQPVPPVQPDSGYYLTTAIADHAIACLKEHAKQHAGQPFFGYLAFTAPHFPLHALPEDIARYRDTYSAGWDAIRQRRWKRLKEMGMVDCDLPPLDPEFRPRYFKPKVLEELGPGEIEHPVAWNQLTEAQKDFQARKMAIHAAMVDRMDQEIGRVLDQMRDMRALDNTLVVFLSDNGADASVMVRGDRHDRAAQPGSATTFLCLGPGWASASNAPFRMHKIWTHEGGISTPLIVHWPRGIAGRGEVRRDVGHVIDLVPTFLVLAGAAEIANDRGQDAPPLPGQSLVPSLAGDRGTQRELFFQHEGNRGLREKDWKLVSAREHGGGWELYDLATDRCEQHDLAARQPDRVKQMAARWKELDGQFQRDATSRK